MSLWKCKDCGEVVESKSTSPSDGYCPKCKKYHQLWRYDPLNEDLVFPQDHDWGDMRRGEKGYENYCKNCGLNYQDWAKSNRPQHDDCDGVIK